ncbi:MAG: sialidase family protein [Betaproteobacteria bacterium]
MRLQHLCSGLHAMGVAFLFTFVASTPALAIAPFVVPDTAIEYYHAGFDHYFLTRLPAEIDALDGGRLQGWTRTGRAFRIYVSAAAAGSVAVNPVCRFYIPPQHGDSHFFSASPIECNDVLSKISVDPNYSGYTLESPDVFYAPLPNTISGSCPANHFPVYRLWNQRADSNHRYTTDPGIKTAMLARGYVAEGYGNDAVSLCSPTAVLVDALTRASGTSPFAAGCERVTSTGVAAIGAEVEPYLAINPVNPNNFIGVWQQDRWSNGGARGVSGAISMDGGGTWMRTSAPFSRCSGGTVANGGDYERATDPWVTFSPDGVAYQIALGFNNRTNADNAILVSRSIDGGQTWSNATTVRRDGADAFNDKEAITADPTDARYVFAVWDRLSGNNGPTWFARTSNGGATWEPAREIYNPGTTAQTINNQIVVLPDGTVVLFFTELATVGNADARLRIIRSSDKGATWSSPITVAEHQSLGTVDPETGNPIRDGSILGAIAAGKNGTLAVVWQDARFAGGARDGIAFARSTDGGFTWSTPVRVNGAPAVPAFLPTVAIRDDGVIGVSYYDFRSNTIDPNTLPTDSWLATSSDGVSWQESSLAATFDYATAPIAGGSLFLGDYTALATVGTSFVTFAGRTTGNPANRSDIFASLYREPVNVAAVAKMVRMDATTMPSLTMTPDLAARLDANARRALAQRLADRTTP